jgi:7-carboxy-7-deazaguanine synthase
MRIAEIFRSLQGEGRLTATESIFVRTSGCNLRCGYCDTPYASWTPQGEDLSVTEILDHIRRVRQAPRPSFLETTDAMLGRRAADDVRHVVLTGGEPMLSAEMLPLCESLRSAGWHITIETSGTCYLPVDCDLMSISPKLTNSSPRLEVAGPWTRRHAIHRHVPEVVRCLTAAYDYQLKFVIDQPKDCCEVEAYLADFPTIDRGRVMLMPQGKTVAVLSEKATWLAPYCQAQGLQFCPRRQIEWFGSQPGR